jgi:hypothetical protein
MKEKITSETLRQYDHNIKLILKKYAARAWTGGA